MMTCMMSSMYDVQRPCWAASVGKPERGGGLMRSVKIGFGFGVNVKQAQSLLLGPLGHSPFSLLAPSFHGITATNSMSVSISKSRKRYVHGCRAIVASSISFLNLTLISRKG